MVRCSNLHPGHKDQLPAHRWRNAIVKCWIEDDAAFCRQMQRRSFEKLFFLMGAMTIVERVDSHESFSLITDRIQTTNKRSLLWTVGFLTFFMSAILDNLTTTIVMVSLLRKLIHDREDRLRFIGLIVIAANAGGAWTVIGDVTTTMLWIKHKIETVPVMQELFWGSLVCFLVPLVGFSIRMPGQLSLKPPVQKVASDIQPWHRWLFLILGVVALLAVGALSATGWLTSTALWLDHSVQNRDVVAIVIGLVSSVVDNVPLVAAGLEMYQMPTNDPFWMLLAYCAGTGGSCLIIGSAAGVAAMGIETVDFVWYVKHITGWAVVGYFAGAAVVVATLSI
ncbi:Na(+)/H(+) antiporter NhaD [Rubripirellula lacrimiformis]|uniref:Na(+)/H(+) antiporter NhaD n=1 Tax=Rubripirellula lacrimiformis TaxID=1930273 RepID=A0A517NFJ3_9BACT|nr:SLC13 family permease [Rubripirellula lacrimiformis]QDT05904.1 Na(+)/H(+) antiporter NhaD [Rubripirellula lacrimiformis]